MPTCLTCKFYDYGKCARFPPKVFLTPPENGSIFETQWPTVEQDDFCGEFQAVAPGA